MNRSTLRTGALLSLAFAAPCIAQVAVPKRTVEAYPEAVAASIVKYRKSLAPQPGGMGLVPYYILVEKVERWKPGQTLKVAFNGGNPDLRKFIAGAANTWIDKGHANIVLSFTNADGSFRTWKETDTKHAAEIRIAFATGKNGGYWSHVGVNSVNTELKGGKPGEPSMNFGGFDAGLPSDGEAVVIHEFGHALGFKHEHQHPVQGCDFRFDDDPGYEKTTDSDGWYTNDNKGRRPGLYTYLGGYSNYWSSEMVDYNLRALKASSAFLIGTFDKYSVMKYFFDPFMFVAGDKSPCYTDGENLTLSEQDIVGVTAAYPKAPEGIARVRQERVEAFRELRSAPGVDAAVVRRLEGAREVR